MSRMLAQLRTNGPQTITSRDAIKTYRYLRVGMVGAVVLLAVSIVLERRTAGGCWQTSISAYYYTPVRAIFVGGLFAVGLSLIVIKGRGLLEDLWLNLAGMLAPVVAVAPTTDLGRCWSVEPQPLPLRPDGELAGWVTTNVDNNIDALVITGAFGLAFAVVLAVLLHRGVIGRGERLERGTPAAFAATAAALGVVWWANDSWSGFGTRAHGIAAVLMFLALIAAVVSKALQHVGDRSRRYVPIYSAIAVSMVVGGLAVSLLRVGGDHTVFVLEAVEIALFAVFWIVQTIENWDETTGATPPDGSGAALGGS